MAKINEIFSSIQGEGPVVGFKQLFIRFCNCNLKCKYCDTEFIQGKDYTAQELFEEISKYDLKTFHSISLTGGEPLMSVDFLEEFLPLIKGKTKIYLETNATLSEEFEKVKKYIDIVSCDIKLQSTSGMETIKLHEKFFSKCSNLQCFAKVVFDSNITEEEIKICAMLSNKYDIELVLQPMMIGEKMSVNSDFCNKILDKFSTLTSQVRLIPQVHKFLNVR